MNQKFLILITTLFVSSLANADVTKQSLDITGEKISEYVSNLIPGEGLTETSIKINDATSDEINFSILGVRDISSTDRSNIFTQFSLANEEINSSGRITGNLGFGYRRLSEDENFMFGANTFYDRDLTENHERLGLGLEAKASIVDITLNNYKKITDSKVIDGTREQVLSGWDYNLTTQIPRAPWASFNYKGYKWEAEKAAQDSSGHVYSLELDLTNSLEFIVSIDNSAVGGVKDVALAEISYVYPPKDKSMVMTDGLSDDLFEKENMKQKLKEKVRRQNKLAVEIQGAVIFTKK